MSYPDFDVRFLQKTYTDVFGQQTMERGCSSPCVEGITDYGIQGDSERWCCDKDLCNKANRLAPLSLVNVATIVVVLRTIQIL